MQIGNARSSPGIRAVSSNDSRVRIQLRLPCTVLISPLWAMKRYGWASGHDGNVLVENRLCTSASADRHALVAQVGEERRQLRRGEHALVDEGPRRQRREERALLGRQLVLDALAGDEHQAVEVDATDRRRHG